MQKGVPELRFNEESWNKGKTTSLAAVNFVLCVNQHLPVDMTHMWIHTNIGDEPSISHQTLLIDRICVYFHTYIHTYKHTYICEYMQTQHTYIHIKAGSASGLVPAFVYSLNDRREQGWALFKLMNMIEGSNINVEKKNKCFPKFMNLMLYSASVSQRSGPELGTTR